MLHVSKQENNLEPQRQTINALRRSLMIRRSMAGVVAFLALFLVCACQQTYSSKTGFLSYQHEQAYLLAKGRPPLPARPIADVLDMPYSGNKLHPTQKPIAALAPLIRSFTLPGELVLDPFAGSGSTCATASLCNRQYLGIELDPAYFEQAVNRMARIRERAVR
jgi:DNA modification methylase